jgi:hypothetical protein
MTRYEMIKNTWHDQPLTNLVKTSWLSSFLKKIISFLYFYKIKKIFDLGYSSQLIYMWPGIWLGSTPEKWLKFWIKWQNTKNKINIRIQNKNKNQGNENQILKN